MQKKNINLIYIFFILVLFVASTNKSYLKIKKAYPYNTNFKEGLKLKPFKPGDKKSAQETWVDSVLNTLNDKQRIGQLFMVAAFSNKGTAHVKEIEKLVADYGIGGVIFFQGGPNRQAVLTNYYQSISKVPLFVAMDAEWGLGMRLDSTMSFPKQMTLGAIQDNDHIYKMGAEIARHCKRLGVQINFAPVVDVNSNPNNPVIGIRSFGEIKEKVAEKGIAYVKGMQDNGVMANAKHFPGHGDTGSDSHLTLPVINHSKERILETELYPFRRLIKDSVMSIMVAHIHIPAFDSTPNMATTLSKPVVTNLLKEEMKFQGLIFTDALNMKGVSKYFVPGEVDLKALKAGNDVLLYAENVPVAIGRIQEAIACGDLSKEEINEKVRKILRAKYFTGLNKCNAIDLKNLYEDLNDAKAKAVQEELFSKALTIVNNNDKFLPLKILDTLNVACVSIGLEKGNNFQQMMDKYTNVTHYAIPKNQDAAAFAKLLEEVKRYEMVVVGLHGINNYNSRDYGITENSKKFLEKLKEETKTILAVFGNPYSLKYFSKQPNLICAYEDNEVTQKIVPQLIFGGLEARGRLPVTVHPELPVGKGVFITSNTKRMSYGFPESVGMSSVALKAIDTVVYEAIEKGATPGCQVVVAKDGKVIFNKSYGHLTYTKKDQVTDATIYDIASVSKVAGTLQAIMFLTEKGLINIEKKASHYLPELKNTNKEDLIIRDILTHQAGLVPYLAHWKRTLDSNNVFNNAYFCASRSDSFNREVVPGLYCVSSIEDSLWKWTIESNLLPEPKETKGSHKYGKKVKKTDNKNNYVYSDLGFYILKKLAERIVNQPLDEFMEQNFYTPLGLTTMTYHPLDRFSSERIAPTEDDKVFRKTQIRGNVHDQGAALLGGVAGHAGIFSNANDLAILMQMNLMKGEYGGHRYFQPQTIPTFAEKQFSNNRRGLGWDKPETDPKLASPASTLASPNTFGHTGFTGTAVWIDPDYNLVYVFLSNRVFPDASNNKLVRMNVRTTIQDVIYKSIIDKPLNSQVIEEARNDKR